jgi:hypothetical protein
MNIIFMKSHGDNDYYFYSVRKVIDYETPIIPEVETLLEQRFGSISFIECINGVNIFRNFRFGDKADEAAYLLWSNEGVEI